MVGGRDRDARRRKRCCDPWKSRNQEPRGVRLELVHERIVELFLLDGKLRMGCTAVQRRAGCTISARVRGVALVRNGARWKSRWFVERFLNTRREADIPVAVP